MVRSIQTVEQDGTDGSLQRTLVLAPHPDDDVIAAGGLLQRVTAAGGQLRIVFVTDGENNPWPQRWMHKKWSITEEDRRQWGLMRRNEALRSLALLGVSRDTATFLALPDRQLTAAIRTGDTRLCDLIGNIIAEYQPTLIIAPSSRDLHPDHRAIAWAAQIAAGDTMVMNYMVHGNASPDLLALRVQLTEHEKRRKRAAIECHASQLLLCRERFLAFAQAEESFYQPEPDVIQVHSHGREVFSTLRQSLRALMATFPLIPSGIEAPADVQDRAGDVPSLL